MAIGPRSRGHLVIGLPRDAFRPSVIFLSLAALFVFSGWMLWSGFGNERVDAFLFVVSGWLVSLCLHEYAHALLAYRAGDVGVAERGYLTLNPLKYSHPVLSIVLPLLALVLGGIGLPGGAVWVDRHYVRSRPGDKRAVHDGAGRAVLARRGRLDPRELLGGRGLPGVPAADGEHPQLHADTGRRRRQPHRALAVRPVEARLRPRRAVRHAPAHRPALDPAVQRDLLQVRVLRRRRPRPTVLPVRGRLPPRPLLVELTTAGRSGSE